MYQTPPAAPADTEPYGGEPPPEGPVFENRTRELAELRSLWRRPPAQDLARPAVAVLSGPVGIGKTSLVVRFAHEVDRDPDHRALYADLTRWRRPGGAADLRGLLRHLLGALGVARHWTLPDTYAELRGMYLRRTRTVRLLLALDGVLARDEVEALLPASPESVVLVACARPLPTLTAVGLPLDGLAPDHAVAVLRAMLRGTPREELGPEALARVAGVCGGFPGLLTMAGGLLRSHPGRRVERLVAELTSRLTQEGTMANGLADEVYAGLPPQARRLYRLLPYHPGYDIGTDAAAALLGTGLDESEDALEALAETELAAVSTRVRADGPFRLRLPDVWRPHALRRAQRDGGEAEAGEGLLRLLCWYRRQAERADRAIAERRLRVAEALGEQPYGPDVAFKGEAEARAWFETESGALHGLVRVAEDLGGTAHEHGAALCEPLWKEYEESDGHDTAADSFAGGVAMAQSAGLVELAVRLRSQLSQPFARTGRHAEALDQAAQAVRSAAAVAPGTLLQASALEFRGKALEASGDHAGAVADYRASRAVHEALPDSAYGVALQGFLTGRALRRAGDAASAAAEQEAALPVARSTGNHRLIARVLTETAALREASGDAPGAVAAYEEALAHEEARGAKFDVRVALHESLAALGETPDAHRAAAGELRLRAGVPEPDEPR
ncbi:hypothetical protein AB0910_24005 [Streptomyces sp. NPDC047002]|uniref:hypothetical protein n=1 Tax=Streptomyces sp. NPDC047002 TaxID=3155475 RepID=UPI00345387F0